LPIKQPNSAHCFACGVANPVGLQLSFFETGADEVTAGFSPPEHFVGFPGVLHGGIIATVLDEIGGRAAMIGDHTRLMMTAKMDIKFRKPTPLGQPLRAVGHLLRRRGRLAFTHAELRLPDGTVTAEAELTLADLPDSQRPTLDLTALGWRVYPDGERAE
jgi:uncharacterized protein (TIGR00369 family)